MVTSIPFSKIHLQALCTPFLRTLTAKWSWYRRSCGYRSSILGFLELYLRKDLKHNVTSSLPFPSFSPNPPPQGVAAEGHVQWRRGRLRNSANFSIVWFWLTILHTWDVHDDNYLLVFSYHGFWNTAVPKIMFAILLVQMRAFLSQPSSGHNAVWKRPALPQWTLDTWMLYLMVYVYVRGAWSRGLYDSFWVFIPFSFF